MGEVDSRALTIALQYASHQMDQAKEEIELLQEIIDAILRMERAKMFKVSSQDQTDLLKAYKGTLTKLTSFRSGVIKKRNAAALRAGKKA